MSFSVGCAVSPKLVARRRAPGPRRGVLRPALQAEYSSNWLWPRLCACVCLPASERDARAPNLCGTPSNVRQARQYCMRHEFSHECGARLLRIHVVAFVGFSVCSAGSHRFGCFVFAELAATSSNGSYSAERVRCDNGSSQLRNPTKAKNTRHLSWLAGLRHHAVHASWKRR